MPAEKKTAAELRDEGYILASEAREFLGLSEMQLSRLIATGQLSEPFQQSPRRNWFKREAVERVKRVLDFDAERDAGYTVSVQEFAKRLGWPTEEIQRVYGKQGCKVIAHKRRWSEKFVERTVAEWEGTSYNIPGRAVRKAILKVHPTLGWFYQALIAKHSPFGIGNQQRGKERYFEQRGLKEAVAIAQRFVPIDQRQFRELLEGITYAQLNILESIGPRNTGLLFPPKIDGRRVKGLTGEHWYLGEAKAFARQFLADPKAYLARSWGIYVEMGRRTNEPRKMPPPHNSVLDLWRRYEDRFDKE